MALFRTNKQAELLKVGDLVTTDFHPGAEKVVRRITFIRKDGAFGSGYTASVDGGKPCKLCGRVENQISGVDAAWFIPVKEK